MFNKYNKWLAASARYPADGGIIADADDVACHYLAHEAPVRFGELAGKASVVAQ